MKAAPRLSAALAALGLALAACGGPGQSLARAGGGISILPNVGAYAQSSTKVDSDGTIEVHEAIRGHYQWLDDKDNAGNGDISAGDYKQIDVTLFWRTTPEEKRHWLFRFGAVSMKAGSNPNILPEPGRYFGVLFGGAFETKISPRSAIGPQVSLSIGYNFKQGVVGILPQLTWGIRYTL